MERNLVVTRRGLRGANAPAWHVMRRWRAGPRKIVALAIVGACLLVVGCDPGPGGLIYRYIVSNECGVPIRADVSDVEGVERIPNVREQDLLAPGVTRSLADSFVEVDTIYVSVSRESASETENIYPFNLADLTAEPTEIENEFAYTFVIEGAMCPSG